MFRNQYVFPSDDINDMIPIEEMVYEKDSMGRPKNAQAVDQFDSQPFMFGENGFRRSDVSILMSAESEDLKLAIASRIQELKASSPDYSGLSDSEIAAMTIPRCVNSAAQFRDWASSLDKSGFAKQVDSFIEANKAKFEQKDTIAFERTDTSVSES